MAGTLHQGILWLFEDDPWLAFDLRGIPRPVDGTPVDRRADVERDDPQMFKIHPYIPDLVFVYRDPVDPKIGIVISVEAQWKPVHRQRFRIPVCQAILADKHQLDTWPVVVAFSQKTADLVRSWATGGPPRVDALVIAADNVPRVTSIEQARVRPAMAALCAALHGCNGDLESVRVACVVFRELPEPLRRRYRLTVLSALPEAEFELIRREQHDMDIDIDERYPLWEIEEKSGLFQYFRRRAHDDGRTEGREEGRTEGREEGRTEGREEGLLAGRKSGLVEMIFALLEIRRIESDPVSAARIRECGDLSELELWARRAREVNAMVELFNPG